MRTAFGRRRQAGPVTVKLHLDEQLTRVEALGCLMKPEMLNEGCSAGCILQERDALAGTHGQQQDAAAVEVLSRLPRVCRFLRAAGDHDSRWGDGRQHDAQEFLHSILEQMQVGPYRPYPARPLVTCLL